MVDTMEVVDMMVGNLEEDSLAAVDNMAVDLEADSMGPEVDNKEGCRHGEDYVEFLEDFRRLRVQPHRCVGHLVPYNIFSRLVEQMHIHFLKS
jgi:hypothetical protein